LARNHEHVDNKTVDYFFHQLVKHIFVCNAILLMHKTSIFSVLLQLKDLISENIQIKSKLLAKVVFDISF